jgi:hypothetical protein
VVIILVETSSTGGEEMNSKVLMKFSQSHQNFHYFHEIPACRFPMPQASTLIARGSSKGVEQSTHNPKSKVCTQRSL